MLFKVRMGNLLHLKSEVHNFKNQAGKASEATNSQDIFKHVLKRNVSFA